MNDDPQAKWRRLGAPPVPATAPQETAIPVDAEYTAFKLLDKGISEFLSVKRTSGLARRLSYHGLVDMIDDDELGTHIALVFNFGVIVQISGENLQPLILSFVLKRAETIREHNPALWPKPAPGQPVIWKIDIETKWPDAVPPGEMVKRSGNKKDARQDAS